jgi:hypothetical protein
VDLLLFPRKKKTEAYDVQFVYDPLQLEKLRRCIQYPSSCEFTLPLLTEHRTKSDEGTLFLGDGSMAGAPTPKPGGKGIRPVIKVLDDKCLYVSLDSSAAKLTSKVFLIHRKTML